MTEKQREALVFVGLTFLLSAFFYAYLFLSANPRWNPVVAWAFMWCPGVAAVLTKLLLRRPLSELGLRWGSTRRFIAGVVLLPIALVGVVYVIVWTTGLGRFSLDRMTAAFATLGQGATPSTGLIIGALISVVPFRILTGAVSTLGEELGWRGLLVPSLAATRSPAATSLITGVVWSLWHYPLVFVVLPKLRPGLPRWYALLCFSLTLTGISFVYTWLRLRSGSVWPAVFLHSSSTTMQEMLEALTQDSGRTFFLTYEYGVGFVVIVALILAAFWRPLTAPAQPAPVEAAMP
jgi:membrane protease YdiL (CAAX protease family)